MARSDNTLQVGLCPETERHDVDLFMQSLALKTQDPQEVMLPSKVFKEAQDAHTRIYAPPPREINVLFTCLESGESEVLANIQGPSIVVATEGSGMLTVDGTNYQIRKGFVYFIGYGETARYEAQECLKLFTAFVE
jgi:mannose-6-phosphate isomerase